MCDQPNHIIFLSEILTNRLLSSSVHRRYEVDCISQYTGIYIIFVLSADKIHKQNCKTYLVDFCFILQGT